MNLYQLKALDALATYGTCLQAARALGVTQPAVSKQLRKLQDSCKSLTIFFGSWSVILPMKSLYSCYFQVALPVDLRKVERV
jgi:hypothetical protein